jgi:hypothetical protein
MESGDFTEVKNQLPLLTQTDVKNRIVAKDGSTTVLKGTKSGKK